MIAADFNRSAAQAIKLRIEGQKARTTEVFQELINSTNRPDLVLNYRRELAATKTDAQAINATLNFLDRAADEVRSNNQGARKERLDEIVAYNRNRLQEILGFQDDLARAKRISDADQQHQDLLNRQAANVKLLNEQWNITASNLGKIKDMVIAPMLEQDAPFFKLVIITWLIYLRSWLQTWRNSKRVSLAASGITLLFRLRCKRLLTLYFILAAVAVQVDRALVVGVLAGVHRYHVNTADLRTAMIMPLEAITGLQDP